MITLIVIIFLVLFIFDIFKSNLLDGIFNRDKKEQEARLEKAKECIKSRSKSTH